MNAYLYTALLYCIITISKSSGAAKYEADTVAKPAKGWHAVASLPGPRAFGTGFSIGNFGYVGGGVIDFSNNADTGYDDMFVYEPVKNTWTKKHWLPVLSSPKNGRVYPFSFVINNTAYAGGGLSLQGVGGTDLERYDPVKDQWTPMARMPGPKDDFDWCIATVYNNKGYIFSYRLDYEAVWEFDPATDTLRKSGFSGKLTSSFALNSWLGASGDQLLYFSRGQNSTFANINPATDSVNFYTSPNYYAKLPNEWTATKTGTRYKNCIYVSFGDAGHMYRYNLVKHLWQTVILQDLGVSDGVSTFLIGSKLYIAGGSMNGMYSMSTTNVWEIDLDAYPEN